MHEVCFKIGDNYVISLQKPKIRYSSNILKMRLKQP